MTLDDGNNIGDRFRIESGVPVLETQLERIEREQREAKNRDAQISEKQLAISAGQLRVNRWLMILTGLLVLTSFLSNYIVNQQTKLAVVASNAAKSAADTASATLIEMQTGGGAKDTHSLAEQAVKQSKQTAILATAASNQATTAQQSESAMLAYQRAFIFPRVSYAISFAKGTRDFDGVSILIDWRNTGTSPTRAMRAFVSTGQEEPLDNALSFSGRNSTSNYKSSYVSTGTAYVPPNGSISMTGFRLPKPSIDRISEGRERFYIWGLATYRDIFAGTQDHQTEFCYRVENTDKNFEMNPIASNLELRFENCNNHHNCYDKECQIPR